MKKQVLVFINVIKCDIGMKQLQSASQEFWRLFVL